MLRDFLLGLSGCEWIALASMFAIMLSQGLSSDEIATLASFFSSVGDNLGIIATTSNYSDCQSDV